MIKKFFVFILALLVCCFLLWIIADLWSQSKLKQACADWPLIDRSLVDLVQVIPRTSANQATQDLKALYDLLRFDVGEDRQAPSDHDRDAVNTMRKLLADYLEQEFGQSTALLKTWSYTLAPDGTATFQYPHPLPDLYSETPAEHFTYTGRADE